MIIDVIWIETKQKKKNVWFVMQIWLTLVAPTHVTINGATEARVGDIVPLQCVTEPSNPPAEIKWTVNGRSIRNATSKTHVSPDGKFTHTYT